MSIKFHPKVYEMTNSFKTTITITIKELLENKHLYQNVLLDETKFLNKHIRLLNNKNEEIIRNAYNHIITNNWYPHVSLNPSIVAIKNKQENNFVIFDTPDVKLYCKVCKRIEAFNINQCEDYLHIDEDIDIVFRHGKKTIQNFILSFTCQSCKLVPEVFIIRRESFKLINCGRSPIEFVDSPNIIPNEIKHFFSNALLAYQSGQTLAGIFYFRVLIEQFVYSKIENFEDLLVDDAIEKYMQNLPSDFKNNFPSIRELYSLLSFDIHKAIGDEDLFQKSKDQIIEHFEARKLFKL